MMPHKTKINWCDYASNPVKARAKATGKVGHYCEPVSAGCANCYASRMQSPYLSQVPFSKAHRDKVEVFLDEKELQRLASSKAICGKRVFIEDMSDLFGEWVGDEWLDRLFGVFLMRFDVTFCLLTKRPERMAEYVGDPQRAFRVAKAVDRMDVQRAMKATPRQIRPLSIADGYFISNTGQVFTTKGSENCVWCGGPITGGQQDTIFCGRKCKSASHYAGSQGRNREPAGRIMRAVPTDTGDSGHQRVLLIGHGRELVHRLVLSTFDREPEGNEQGCHRDGDPPNNHIANLRWGSQSKNWADRKRHGNHRAHQELTEPEAREIERLFNGGHSAAGIAREFGVSETQVRNIGRGDQWATTPTLLWPLPGVWLGTSVENQAAADARIPILCRIPAAVRFLSVEPMLGPVDLEVAPCGACNSPGDVVEWPCPYCEMRRFEWPDWVIVGGESGPHCRPCDPDWIRSVVDQCQAAGVAVWVKQLGGHPDKRDRLDDLPEDLRIRELPRSAG